jgi:hypothetical protein
VTGTDDNAHRTLNVVVGRDSANTSVNVTYGRK